MSIDGVSSDEMAGFSDMDDRDIERLFAGQAPEGDADLAVLARFVEDVAEAHPEASTDALEAAHVAAMVEAAHLSAENGDPAARPASKAHGSARQASGLPKWRRNPMLKRLFGSPAARVAAIVAVLALAFSGVAIAGALPDQLQRPVSDAAQSVGVDIPSPDDEVTVDEDADDPVDADDAVEAVETPDAGDLEDEKAAIIDDDQGEDADDQGEEADHAEEAQDQTRDQADDAQDQAEEARDQADDRADEAQDEAEEARDQADDAGEAGD